MDASAILALTNLEPGASRVFDLLTDAMISTANLAEVGTRLVDKGFTLEQVRASFARLDLKVIDLDAQLADAMISLRLPTRSAGLSLADRACLALAMREGAVAVTCDRAWRSLKIGCEIEVIR